MKRKINQYSNPTGKGTKTVLLHMGERTGWWMKDAEMKTIQP